MKKSRFIIETAYDYNDVCDDILTDWLEDFTLREGLTRAPNEDDFDSFGHDNIKFMYTQKGMKLYHAACKKLENLGKKYFDKGLNIKSGAMLFP